MDMFFAAKRSPDSARNNQHLSARAHSSSIAPGFPQQKQFEVSVQYPLANKTGSVNGWGGHFGVGHVGNSFGTKILKKKKHKILIP
jgi:hypothetical protein